MSGPHERRACELPKKISNYQGYFKTFHVIFKNFFRINFE